MNISPLSLFHNSRLAALAGLAAGLSIASTSSAQVRSWTNAAGGSAGTSTNWSPVGVPLATDILNFNLAGAFAVSFPATVPTSAQLNFGAGTLSLSALSPHTATTQFALGLAAGSTPSVTFTSGSLSAPVISVATNATSTSTLAITGTSSNMFSTGAGGTRIGNPGNGTLNITSGGSLQSTNAVSIAAGAGSQGAVTVSGIVGPVRSELSTTDATNGDLNVGLSGNGTLSVLSGGALTIADDMFIGPTATFTSSTTIGSAGTTSLMTVSGDLHIGHNLTAASAGAGTLTVNPGANIAVIGNTFVGDSAGGTGFLIHHDDSIMTTTSLTIDSAHGVFEHLGGDIRVVNGVFTAPNNQYLMNGATGEFPRIFLVNSTCTLSAVSPGRALTIGSSHFGFFDVESSGALNIPAGDMVLGDLSGSHGTFQLQTSATLTLAPTGLLTVGNNGGGTFTASSLAHSSSGSVQIGAGATGDGAFVLSGGSSRFDIAGTVAIGGTHTSSGGSGSMTIGNNSANSGVLTVTSGVIPGGQGVKVWNNGSLTINAGGRLNVDQAVVSSGVLTLAGGTIDASNVVLASPGPNLLSGNIVRLFQPGSSGIATLSGPLSVGALFNDGAVNVGDQQLTLGGSSTCRIGNCSVGASGRVVSPVSLVLLTDKVLSGDGTIDADIDNSGSITATGGGLTINGIVSGIGQGIGGTRIDFGTGGGFTGSGSFSTATPVFAATGSVIRSTGNLTMGTSSSSAGFRSEGSIAVTGNSQISLLDSDGAVITDVAFINGDPADMGAVRNGNGLAVRGVVTGTGMLDASVNDDFMLQGATLSPGSSSASGLLALNGEINLTNAANRVEFDIFDASTHDEVRTLSNVFLSPFHTIPSNITLGGTLVLRVSPSHTPTNGETHHLIVTNQGLLGPDGTVFGNFASLVVPRHWIIRVVAIQSASQENGVFAIYCTADFNEDGTVDFFDYLDFVDALSSADSTADFNRDSVIDFFDYLDFVDAFSQGC